MGLPLLATVGSAIGAGASVYSTVQQSRSAQAAAEFNAEQARNAAKVKDNDARQNALRRQEENRKYLASIRARMLESSPTIEGGAADFLEEATGDLELRVLDQSVRLNREQASLSNQAFRMDWQADQMASARPVQTAASALTGFNNVYRTGQRAGYWGRPKQTRNALN
jgi:hypothetical protein